jgi:hypothetical protein
MKWMQSGIGSVGSNVLAVMLLVGCAGLDKPDSATAPVPAKPRPLPQTQEVVPVPPSAADEVMAWLDRIGGATPAELVREYDTLAALPEPDHGGAGQMRLALLLAQPGLPFRDDAAALRLLGEWEKRQAAADPALKGFVSWFRSILVERGRIAGQLEDSGARMREERKRAEACKEKLEAIKDMEKSLLEREKR